MYIYVYVCKGNQNKHRGYFLFFREVGQTYYTEPTIIYIDPFTTFSCNKTQTTEAFFFGVFAQTNHKQTTTQRLQATKYINMS